MLLVCCSSLYIQESFAAAYSPSNKTGLVNNAVLQFTAVSLQHALSFSL